VAVVLPVLGMGTAGLVVSSLVVGAFTLGVVPLVLGRVHELLPRDVVAQQASWATATTGFALMQATAAYALTFVFTQTGGDYQLLFVLGTGILITALGVDLAVSVFPLRRRAA
jgi:hypothetical protein